MSFLIQLENISKIYQRGETQFHALSNIHLQIKAGEMTAIVGASGSGKSTLMNIMGLLDRASAGEYYFAGQNVANLSDNQWAQLRNRQIGFVFQLFYLLPRATALQNTLLPLFYRGLPRNQAVEQAKSMLERVGVAHLAAHYPHQLSGGQQQRVAIARALVGKPQLILADEPTGALDSVTSQEVMNVFRELCHEKGVTVVIITHDAAISAACQRVVTIKDGKIF